MIIGLYKPQTHTHNYDCYWSLLFGLVASRWRFLARCVISSPYSKFNPNHMFCLRPLGLLTYLRWWLFLLLCVFTLNYIRNWKQQAAQLSLVKLATLSSTHTHTHGYSNTTRFNLEKSSWSVCCILKNFLARLSGLGIKFLGTYPLLTSGFNFFRFSFLFPFFLSFFFPSL